MSKDTPEVGDVWKNNRYGDLLHITDVRGDERYTKFSEYYTYLGKSKANINDLFKTENEE